MANLTLLDPNVEWVVDPGAFRSRSRNTPFGGRKLIGRSVGDPEQRAGVLGGRAGHVTQRTTGPDRTIGPGPRVRVSSIVDGRTHARTVKWQLILLFLRFWCFWRRAGWHRSCPFMR